MNNNVRVNPNRTPLQSNQVDQENSAILQNDNTTTIHIENGLIANQSQHLLSQSIPEASSSTSINIEENMMNEDMGPRSVNSRASVRSIPQNFLSLLSEARTHLGRQTSYPGSLIQNHHVQDLAQFANINHNDEANPVARNWRTNLNTVLSLSTGPTREALRSLIYQTRYTQLPTGENIPNLDNVHINLNHDQHLSSNETPNFRLSARRISSPLQDLNSSAFIQSPAPSRQVSVNSTGRTLSTPPNSPEANENNSGPHSPVRDNNGNRNNTNDTDMDEDNTVISNMLIMGLSHFVRYVPFICIIFIKFMHDYIVGILDVAILHIIMFNINASLRNQIAKFSTKNYQILVRDFCFVFFVVGYRFLLASTAPDPFGLLIAPPREDVSVDVSVNGKDEILSNSIAEQAFSNQQILQLTASPKVESNLPNTVDGVITMQKNISLGLLLYYCAVNDLILKLITILSKILVTMLPTKVLRFKPRARLYVLIEYMSQFYRALAPTHQWLQYLFESYAGLEVISGILFSAFYLGAKGFELFERGKSLRTAVLNFVQNMDYERKPTKDELDAAGTLCAICHDDFTSPVVLNCGHIFCDDCVSTWFKREQTCPMCRAKVSEDPRWQDGTTTFFYQLC